MIKVSVNKLYLEVAKNSLQKLDPRVQLKNPVMFVTYIGALISTVYALADFDKNHTSLEFQIAFWLWFTVIFANFAEAIAEGRGKAQADDLRKSRASTTARLLTNNIESQVASSSLQVNDLVICESEDIIPGDGEVIEGIASVDESAITGESAPVIRESGGDRSAVTGGTRVISDRIIIRITAQPGNSFLDRMIALVEGAKRQKTPNEIALSILLSGLTIIFLLAVMSLKPFIDFANTVSGEHTQVTVPILMALLVCLIPTTIGGLLSAIGISGMDRLIQKNVIATSGRAVEAAGDIDVLLLDKTGTITVGNRMASQFHAVKGVDSAKLGHAAYLASLADETPEGRSIVMLATQRFNFQEASLLNSVVIPFSAQTRVSGVDFEESHQLVQVRKGAADAIIQSVRNTGGQIPSDLQKIVDDVAMKGSTPLVVSHTHQILGVIELKDVVKPGIRERFAELRKMGIRTVMITGDNPLTAAAIAAEAGVDDFVAQATPQKKLQRIREEQAGGHLVAMTGDGTNDAPALAQADVGVAMNTGTQAAREAGNMIDLDSDPTKLIEIVQTGKQLLMTRGSLTTFSIANDVAKYFAILPALFATLYVSPSQTTGPLSMFNIMHLQSPASAILSAIIFNALIIIALIPLALTGITYRPASASVILRKNLFVFGLGGIALPFLGIKLIDLMITTLGLI